MSTRVIYVCWSLVTRSADAGGAYHERLLPHGFEDAHCLVEIEGLSYFVCDVAESLQPGQVSKPVSADEYERFDPDSLILFYVSASWKAVVGDQTQKRGSRGTASDRTLDGLAYGV